MLTSKLTSKAQTTVPKEVRRILALAPGDVMAYEIQEGRVVLRKAAPIDLDYVRALQSTLLEWNSPEDADAYNDL